MRVLIVAADPDRARLLAQGLAGAPPAELRHADAFDPAEAAAFAPDVVAVAVEAADRPLLEQLRQAGLADPRPVALFVDRSAPGLAEEAVRAGMAAYVVAGLAPARVRAILDVAVGRFRLTHQLRQDLQKAKAELAARKNVERAKALIMKERGLDEDQSYRLLRKLSMDTARPLGIVAADLLALAGLLKVGADG